MGCNCGGSTRQENQVRGGQTEAAARRQGQTLDNANGYYFTGPARPPLKTPTPAAK